MGQFCARARKRADLSSVSIKDEIAALLARHGITAAGFRLGYILIHAELERMICSGPLRGRQHTYALLEERVPRGGEPRGDRRAARCGRQAGDVPGRTRCRRGERAVSPGPGLAIVDRPSARRDRDEGRPRRDAA
jgi:hypothetical protein